VNAQPESLLRIDDLCARVRAYLQPDQIEKIRLAFEFGAAAHHGQKRASGEPYIQHPLEVACILADMHMDHETLIAAILHDVVEDTPIELERVAEDFGSEVSAIVGGLSKLTQLEFESQAETQARNFQRMLMAMADDIRVILVKLADRLHNMRTLGALKPEKRRRIARETLEIYAPIAQRLGINQIRLELEELGFATLYPLRHRVIKQEMLRVRGNRKEVVDKIKDRIKRHLRQERPVGPIRIGLRPAGLVYALGRRRKDLAVKSLGQMRQKGGEQAAERLQDLSSAGQTMGWTPPAEIADQGRHFSGCLGRIGRVQGGSYGADALVQAGHQP